MDRDPGLDSPEASSQDSYERWHGAAAAMASHWLCGVPKWLHHVASKNKENMFKMPNLEQNFPQLILDNFLNSIFHMRCD